MDRKHRSQINNTYSLSSCLSNYKIDITMPKYVKKLYSHETVFNTANIPVYLNSAVLFN